MTNRLGARLVTAFVGCEWAIQFFRFFADRHLFRFTLPFSFDSFDEAKKAVPEKAADNSQRKQRYCQCRRIAEDNFAEK